MRKGDRIFASPKLSVASSLKSRLPDFLAPRLQRLLHQVHKLVSDGTVNQTVIVTQGEMDDRTNSD
jgi:Cft2 family RNA processing exonuclease